MCIRDRSLSRDIKISSGSTCTAALSHSINNRSFENVRLTTSSFSCSRVTFIVLPWTGLCVVKAATTLNKTSGKLTYSNWLRGKVEEIQIFSYDKYMTPLLVYVTLRLRTSVDIAVKTEVRMCSPFLYHGCAVGDNACGWCFKAGATNVKQYLSGILAFQRFCNL